MAIKKEISSHEWQEIQLANLKAHVAGPVDNADIVRGAWTSSLYQEARKDRVAY